MQGSSGFLTVKQVATALGIDERSVREKLNIGTLKGVKRNVGNKDQWFVHPRDLDAELARRGMSTLNQQRAKATSISIEYPQGHFSAPFRDEPPQSMNSTGIQPSSGGSEALFGAADEEPLDFDVLGPEAIAHAPTGTSGGAESKESNSGDPESKESSGGPELREIGSGGERLGWHNEELQKQLMATAEVFMRPLVDRIEALTAADKDKDALLKAKNEELEEVKKQLRLLPDFEAQKAKLLNEIEAQRLATEIQIAKAKEQEEAAQALADENERLKLKAEEAVLNANKLADLERVVQDLQKPKPTFWQKVFGVQKS